MRTHNRAFRTLNQVGNIDIRADNKSFPAADIFTGFRSRDPWVVSPLSHNSAQFKYSDVLSVQGRHSFLSYLS